jgi:hypothetical protein
MGRASDNLDAPDQVLETAIGGLMPTTRSLEKRLSKEGTVRFLLLKRRSVIFLERGKRSNYSSRPTS